MFDYKPDRQECKSISYHHMGQICYGYIHLTDDTSISQQLKYPDQLDPEDVTTPASLHVLQSKDSTIVVNCLLLNIKL